MDGWYIAVVGGLAGAFVAAAINAWAMKKDRESRERTLLHADRVSTYSQFLAKYTTACMKMSNTAAMSNDEIFELSKDLTRIELLGSHATSIACSELYQYLHGADLRLNEGVPIGREQFVERADELRERAVQMMRLDLDSPL